MANEMSRLAKTKSIKKKSRIKKIIGIIILLIILGIGIIYFSKYLLLSKNTSLTAEAKYQALVQQTNHKYSPYNTENIAITVVDNSKNLLKENNSYYILSKNRENNSMKLSKLNNRTLLNIANVGKDTLNKSFEIGNEHLLVSTINNNFGLTINNYITIDISNLESLVNNIGYVTLSLTEGDVNCINGYLQNEGLYKEDGIKLAKNKKNEVIQKFPMTYTLNGAQALAYAKINISNHKNENVILNSLLKSLENNPSQASVNKLLPFIKTNLSTDMLNSIMINLLKNLNTMKKTDFPNISNSSYETIHGSKYAVYDQNILIPDMHKFMFT